MNYIGKRVSLTVFMLLSLSVLSAYAQDDDLLADAQNPLSDLVSVPVLQEVYYGVGPRNERVYVTTAQPVYPIRLSTDWNLITRALIPFLYVPGRVEGLYMLPEGIEGEAQYGLSDINFTPYFSPAKVGKYYWGIGPSLSLPTATADLLGSGKWSVGASGVILVQTNSWYYGVLYRHLWSVAGKDDRAESIIAPAMDRL